MFGNLIKQSVAAKERFSSLTRAGYALAPALTALGGIIGVLGTSLLSLGSIISAATLPALAVLGQSLTAVAQAAITLKLAFSGVGKAIQAGTKAKKAGAKESKALEKAEDRLERAQRALADAYEDAATREVKAKQTITDAEKELSKAREQAIEDLQQIGFESEDAAIAEQKAALELEKARESLARVSDLPPNSRARKEAELAFAQADLNYRKAIDANNDLKKTEAKNAELAKKGPQALIDGQENVVAAIKAEEDARNSYNETIKDNERAILSATEARDDAAEAVDDIKNNAAATDAYADALAELSKEARAFAEYMVNTFIPALKDLKAAAGEELFPKLETALENLRTKLFPALIPLLKETGGVIGDIAIKFSEAVTKGENLERLERIWKSNDTVLTNFGDAAINLYESFLILLDTARPLTEEFSKWVATLTGGWTETLKADEASGKLNEKFQTARGILKDLGKIFGNVFGGLGKIISANVGPGSGGQIFLDYLKEVTGRFKNITKLMEDL
jgi:trimeric autotransporter adhesin